jgi:hypothetical protein
MVEFFRCNRVKLISTSCNQAVRASCHLRVGEYLAAKKVTDQAEFIEGLLKRLLFGLSLPESIQKAENQKYDWNQAFHIPNFTTLFRRIQLCSDILPL